MDYFLWFDRLTILSDPFDKLRVVLSKRSASKDEVEGLTVQLSIINSQLSIVISWFYLQSSGVSGSTEFAEVRTAPTRLF